MVSSFLETSIQHNSLKSGVILSRVENVKHFLDFVLRALAKNPDDIDIRETMDGQLTLFHVTLHSDDVGRVIGRNGRTISAIRSLLTAASGRNDQRVTVEIAGTAESE